MTTHFRSEWERRTEDYCHLCRPCVAMTCHLAEMPHLARARQTTTPNYHSAGMVLAATSLSLCIPAGVPLTQDL